MDPKKIGQSWTNSERLLCLYIIAASTGSGGKDFVRTEMEIDLANPSQGRLAADLWILLRLLEYDGTSQYGSDNLTGVPFCWPRNWRWDHYWIQLGSEAGPEYDQITNSMLELIDSKHPLQAPGEGEEGFGGYECYLEPRTPAALWLQCSSLLARLNGEASYSLRMTTVLGDELSPALGSVSEWVYQFEFLLTVGLAHKSTTLMTMAREKLKSSPVLTENETLSLCEVCSVNAEELNEGDLAALRRLMSQFTEFATPLFRRWLMILNTLLESRAVEMSAFDKKYVRSILHFGAQIVSSSERRLAHPQSTIEQILVWCLKIEKVVEGSVSLGQEARQIIKTSINKADWAEELLVLGVSGLM